MKTNAIKVFGTDSYMASLLRPHLGALETDLQKRVLRMRYGLARGTKPMTTPEIAKELGCTKQNAHSILMRALKAIEPRLSK